jgi:hypothetical protein
MAIKPFGYLNGSLKMTAGLIQISESLVTAYPQEEPSYVHHPKSSTDLTYPSTTFVFPLMVKPVPSTQMYSTKVYLSETSF